MDQEKVIDKVRKLLTLGNHESASEGERENALRMAHGLLAKYNLDMAAVEAAGQKTPDEERLEERPQFYGRPWARRCAQQVGKLFFCEYIYIQLRGSKEVIHVFIGRKSNAITAAEVSRYVVESIRREANRSSRSHGGLGNAWVRSFCLGATSEISQRVHKLIQEATTPPVVKTSSCTALVLANVYVTERSANQLMLAEKHPKLGHGRTGKGTADYTAADAGRAFGRTVSLNRQIGQSAPVGRLK